MSRRRCFRYLERTIEAWGTNSPSDDKSPQGTRVRGLQGEATCVTPSGTCKLTLLNKKDKHGIQDFEKVLKEEGIIEEEELVIHIMEEASFNDTIDEIKELMDLTLCKKIDNEISILD